MTSVARSQADVVLRPAVLLHIILDEHKERLNNWFPMIQAQLGEHYRLHAADLVSTSFAFLLQEY